MTTFRRSATRPSVARLQDLPSLGYKIETTQLHVVRGGQRPVLLEQANMVAPAIADLVSQ